MEDKIQVIILNGPVGVGKSSVAFAIADILKEKNILNAVIDFDYLRFVSPWRDADPWNTKLGMKNLTSILPNYESIGVKYLILSYIIEDSSELEDFKRAIGNRACTLIRLTANLDTIKERLQRRETGESLDWHLHRAKKLLNHFEQHALENIVIDTTNKTPNMIANEILTGI